MERSNTYAHAERELAILMRSVDKPALGPFINEILELCDAFGKSGQSGGSAPYVAKAIAQAVEKLCTFKTICPLTGEDDEWFDVTDMSGSSEGLYQNNRLSSVFKKEKDGRAYFLDAIIFKPEEQPTFTGNGSVKMGDEIIASRQYIKSFPCTPKSFYVDVISTEWADKTESVKKKGGGWWTSTIKDPAQLLQVFEHYDKYIV